MDLNEIKSWLWLAFLAVSTVSIAFIALALVSISQLLDRIETHAKDIARKTEYDREVQDRLYEIKEVLKLKTR